MIKIRTVKDLVELRRKQDEKDIKWHERAAKELKKHDYGKDFRLFQRVFRELGALVSGNRFYVKCKHRFRELMGNYQGTCQKCPANRMRLPSSHTRDCVCSDRRWNKLQREIPRGELKWLGS